MAVKLTDRAIAALESSLLIAHSEGHPSVTSLHLAFAILRECLIPGKTLACYQVGPSSHINAYHTVFKRALRTVQVNDGDVEVGLRIALGKIGRVVSGVNNLDHLQAIMEKAQEMSRNKLDGYVGRKYLLEIALKDAQVEGVLRHAGLEDMEKLRNALETIDPEHMKTEKEDALAMSPEFLNMFADHTLGAKKWDWKTIIGQEEELRRVFLVLLQEEKGKAAVLFGRTGVGKSAIAANLAMRLAEGDCPLYFAGAHLLSICFSALAEAGQKLQNLLRELEKVVDGGQRVILLFDPINLLLSGYRFNERRGLEGNDNDDCASIIFPFLRRGKINFLGVATQQELDKMSPAGSYLLRQFTKIDVLDTDKVTTLAILHAEKENYEKHNLVQIDVMALNNAVSVADCCDPRFGSPSTAIAVLDYACATVSNRRVRANVSASSYGAITEARKDLIDAKESAFSCLQNKNLSAWLEWHIVSSPRMQSRLQILERGYSQSCKVLPSDVESYREKRLKEV